MTSVNLPEIGAADSFRMTDSAANGAAPCKSGPVMLSCYMEKAGHAAGGNMQMKKEAVLSAAQDVKRRNYRSIYDRIYRERRVTKKTLAEALHLSMPTVTQDLAQML